VRLRLVAVMLASLFMSVAIPDAFGQRGLMFALVILSKPPDLGRSRVWLNS
jgi:low temperature requirement protein LtrA